MYISLPLASLGLLASATAHQVTLLDPTIVADRRSVSPTRFSTGAAPTWAPEPPRLAWAPEPQRLARRRADKPAAAANKTKTTVPAAAANITKATVPAGGHPKKYKHFNCGTSMKNATKEFIQISRQLHNNRHKGSVGAGATLHQRRQSALTIDTYFHIVTKLESAGSVTAEMAQQQIYALNAAYNPYDIHFTLQNTTITANDLWAVGADADDLAMKQALRQGTYTALNIYFQTDLDNAVLGRCSLPAQIYGTVPISAFATDGCNVNAYTMPGGNIDQYNQGQTAVHETGHWLGLLHVFEGYTCDGDGDLIADTPTQSVSTDGCPVSPPQDSCPGSPGVDSIHNYMDYSQDSCYEGFSDDQVQRMKDHFSIFRAGH